MFKGIVALIYALTILVGSAGGNYGDFQEPEENYTILCESISKQDSDENDVVYVSFETVNLYDSVAETYPELYKAVEQHNSDISEQCNESADELYEWNLEDDLDGVHYTHELYVGDVYFSDKILSYKESVFVYSGGAHGFDYINCVNLNPENGKEIMLSDVLAKAENPVKIIDAALKSQLGDNYENLQDHIEVMSDYELSDYIWTMSEDAIYFHFASYDIASYADGQITVAVYFDEYPDFVKSIYTE